jgi:hypothetical protein
MRGWQVGSLAPPGRLLIAGWGFRVAEVREMRGERSWKRLPRAPPSFVSNRMRQEGNERDRERERERERERGAR